ncbi:LytR/AlgR family response regulator transcription factor [Paenibacillus sp.]|uniref:LytR/AlgR family response regulator transcription factor n=1 Tax=Paenibacillus sp. TaxID=58172 RepID=UPI00356A3101
MSRVLTVAIAEDQELDRKKLEMYAGRLGLKVVSSTASGTWFLDDCLKYKPDLVFLDIGLHMMDGITAYKRLLEQGLAPYLIMVSGTQDYSLVIAGYELDCISFVTKPVTFEHLSAAVEKARTAFEKDLTYMPAPNSRILEVKASYKTVFINEHKLIYAQKSKGERKAFLYIEGGEVVETTTPLTEILSQCSKQIFCPNPSNLVNLNFVKSIHASDLFFGTYKIKLFPDDIEIDLSRRKRKEFERLYRHE